MSVTMPTYPCFLATTDTNTCEWEVRHGHCVGLIHWFKNLAMKNEDPLLIVGFGRENEGKGKRALVLFYVIYNATSTFEMSCRFCRKTICQKQVDPPRWVGGPLDEILATGCSIAVLPFDWFQQQCEQWIYLSHWTITRQFPYRFHSV